MAKVFQTRSGKKGLPPGTMVHVGEKKAQKAALSLMDYDSKKLDEKEFEKIEDCFTFKETKSVSWINVDGLHETETIAGIGTHYGLHPLVLEDIVNTEQRPKYEDNGDYVYFVMKMLYYSEKGLVSEQVSLVFGKNFVISFQERAGDVFEPVRERLRQEKGNIRKLGADYLAYSLIDAVVDNYFAILEKFGEDIESLEEKLLKSPGPKALERLYRLKREIIFLRKAVWPLREAISGLERSGSTLLNKATLKYFRDVYDHTIQAIDTIETYREMLSGMLDIYLSSVSNKMNEVMKVLTVIATIFIPLTFITGIYGMNFEFMPELGWQPSYMIVWAVMVIIAGAMLYFFKSKKWI